MSVQFLKPAGLCLLMLAIGASFSTEVQAHGGLALAEDMCRLTIGSIRRHRPAGFRNCTDIVRILPLEW